MQGFSFTHSKQSAYDNNKPERLELQYGIYKMFMLQDGGIGCADLLFRDGGRVIISHLHRCGIRGYYDFRDGLFMPVPLVRKDGVFE